jgi:excisionase family DNA binding protein
MPETVIVLSKDEAATRLRISERTVRRYIAAGLLDGVRVGPRLVKVTEMSVDRLLAEGLRAARAALRAATMDGRLAARTIAAVAVALALTACGSGKPAAPAAAASSPAPSSSAPAPAAAPSSVAASGQFGDQVLTCATVVDTDPSMNGLDTTALSSEGFDASALTAEQTIGLLEAMVLTDGLTNIPAGTPSSADTTILGAGAMDLMNYDPDATKLGGDGQQLAADEESYDPTGSVDTSYASPLLADIRALMGDCPQALKWADKVMHG